MDDFVTEASWAIINLQGSQKFEDIKEKYQKRLEWETSAAAEQARQDRVCIHPDCWESFDVMYQAKNLTTHITRNKWMQWQLKRWRRSKIDGNEVAPR